MLLVELLIGFGSETGTSQEIAEYFYRECIFRDVSVLLHPLNDVSLSNLQSSKLCVFVCSTTGDGEEPKNMKQFWRSLLKRSLTSATLANLSFAVLGLGDSSYAKFNYAAKRLYRRLVNLGGTALHTLGLSDEQHPEGSDYQSYTWISELFSKISEKFSIQLDRKYRILPPRYTFTISQTGTHTADTEECTTSSHFTRDNPATSVLLSNRRVTSVEHFQDVRVFELDIGGSEMSYEPGDVVWIYPENNEDDVAEASRILQLDLNWTLTFTNSCQPPHLPNSLSIRNLLTSYLDIVSLPTRYFFETCANFPTDQMEKEKFEEFTTLSAQEDLYSYVTRPRRTILEVLADFQSVQNNLDIRYLFDFIPLVKPRGFSIASSLSRSVSYLSAASGTSASTLEICVAVVKYKTTLKKERLGLCSNWLATIPLQSSVKLFVESGSFYFPYDRPIIMVGPGTGCAPFRSLIQQRAATAQQFLLFFGSRNSQHDYLFAREWEEVSNLRVITAFSRDQDYKIYVQDRIVEHGGLVWELLGQGALFCVAGNSKNMPFQVKEALLQVIEKHGNLSVTESTKYLDQLVKSRLYQTETW